MKIQCDACEKTEAVVLCCADEAALCWDCDEKVHAANKLARKHQRVSLLLPSASSATSKLPGCDICQEKAGYCFCLEDRALLCSHCDLTIHSANPFVFLHHRFLVTGVRIAPQHYFTNNSSSNRSSALVNELSNNSGSNGNSSKPACSLAATSLALERTKGFKPYWPHNQIFEGADLDLCYGLSEPGSSS